MVSSLSRRSHQKPHSWRKQNISVIAEASPRHGTQTGFILSCAKLLLPEGDLQLAVAGDGLVKLETLKNEQSYTTVHLEKYPASANSKEGELIKLPWNFIQSQQSSKNANSQHMILQCCLVTLIQKFTVTPAKSIKY